MSKYTKKITDYYGKGKHKYVYGAVKGAIKKSLKRGVRGAVKGAIKGVAERAFKELRKKRGL